MNAFKKEFFLYKTFLTTHPTLAPKYFTLLFKKIAKVGSNDYLSSDLNSIYSEIAELMQPWLKDKSAFTNIYHCCTHKSGSQWLRQIFSDFRLYQYSGFLPFPVEIINSFSTNDENLVLPQKTVVTGTFHLDYKEFSAFKKQDSYRVFFVLRDPRDILISHYFSLKFSHGLMGRIAEHRKILKSLSLEDGLLYLIDNERYIFQEIKSWLEAYKFRQDKNLMLVHFEKLISSDSAKYFQELLHHCDINIPEIILKQILDDYSFERLSSGRKPGEENLMSHYRKGVSEDWKNYFNRKITDKFYQVTGTLVTDLGYLK